MELTWFLLISEGGNFEKYAIPSITSKWSWSEWTKSFVLNFFEITFVQKNFFAKTYLTLIILLNTMLKHREIIKTFFN